MLRAGSGRRDKPVRLVRVSDSVVCDTVAYGEREPEHGSINQRPKWLTLWLCLPRLGGPTGRAKGPPEDRLRPAIHVFADRS
jgi:hypothetical protein